MKPMIKLVKPAHLFAKNVQVYPNAPFAEVTENYQIVNALPNFGMT
jgi:hypothetical protein